MTLSLRFWRFASLHTRADRGSTSKAGSRTSRERRLRIEPLEDRRLLAVFAVDNLDDAGAGSLRQAILDANAAAGADVIEFQAGVTGTIALSTGEMLITEDLTINGPGAEALTIDAQQNSRIFHITPASGPVTISGLTLTGGNAVGNGGAILSQTDALLSIESSTISANSAIGSSSVFGGGLWVHGDVTISASTVSDNSATGDNLIAGGGLFAGRATVTDSEVSGNIANGGLSRGGGIYAGEVSVASSTISDNSATGRDEARGGGIFFRSDVSVVGSTVSGNRAATDRLSSFTRGGGISGIGDATVLDSTISENSATGNWFVFGGGIFSFSNVSIANSAIFANAIGANTSNSFGYGGGIRADGDVTISDSAISGNLVMSSGTGRGGGIETLGNVTVTESSLSGNSVQAGRAIGGGIAARGRATISQSALAENSATSDISDATGGALYARHDVTVADSTISENAAAGTLSAYGGGIAAYSGSVTMMGSTISGNAVTGGSLSARGGGLHARGEVTITRSTISGNKATSNSSFADGAGFYVSDNPVTVTDSTISNNAADGYATGGAAIAARGDLTVSRSTISGNSAKGERSGQGGGIAAGGNVALIGSTISENSAYGDFSTIGGGIASFGDQLMIANSTISGNLVSGSSTTGGGGIWASSEVTIHSSTVAQNSLIGGLPGSAFAGGGGIFVFDDAVLIENTIVAGNHAADSPDLRPGTGPLTVHYSLIGDNTNSGLAPAPAGMSDANGNVIGTAAAPIDPMLGPLQDNGGPTFTHALLPGSPAINAGDPGFMPPPDFDQRGDPFVRVSGGRIDMGAFELQRTSFDEQIQQLLDEEVLNVGQANALLVKLNDNGTEQARLNRLQAFINQVNAMVQVGILTSEQGQPLIDGAERLRESLHESLFVDAVLPIEDTSVSAVFAVDNLNDAGVGSLRQAILDANLNLGADTIEFQADLSGTIALSTGEMLITDDVTINGPGAEALTIDAQQNSRIFYITEASGPVTISGLHLTGGASTEDGGAVLSETEAQLSVEDSTISGNTATDGSEGNGGAIYADGDVTVAGSTISDNSAGGSFFGAGGGIAALGDVTIISSTISENSVTGGSFIAVGGGIVALGDVSVSRSTISGNSVSGALAFGGGISDGDLFGGDGNLTVTDSTISGNSALGDEAGGGGIFAYEMSIRSSTISGNLASGGGSGPFAGGGGVAAVNDPVTIENSIVAGNQTLDGTAPDLLPGTGPLAVRYSLIGDNTDTGLAEAPVGMPDANGNLIGDPTGAGVIDPMLGPLGDNGGPTFTHALLPGSPAINAGDPGFLPPPDFDQRGDPFLRVVGGRIDMGAFEVQTTDLDEQIQQLLDDGVLNHGQANALLAKLNENGTEQARINRLQAFINQVNALVQAGILTSAEGQSLIDGAESLINMLAVDLVLPLVVT